MEHLEPTIISLKRKALMDSENEISTSSTTTLEMKAIENRSDSSECGEASLGELYKCNDFSDIAKCFSTLHSKVLNETVVLREKIKVVENELVEVKQNIEYIQHEVAAIQEDEIPKVSLAVLAEKHERLKLDLWSRKWNLVIKGVKGGNAEIRQVTEGKVRELFKKDLHLSHADTILVQALHRLPGGPLDKKNING
jgi:hypothetical protein